MDRKRLRGRDCPNLSRDVLYLTKCWAASLFGNLFVRLISALLPFIVHWGGGHKGEAGDCILFRCPRFVYQKDSN